MLVEKEGFIHITVPGVGQYCLVPENYSLLPESFGSLLQRIFPPEPEQLEGAVHEGNISKAILATKLQYSRAFVSI